MQIDNIVEKRTNLANFFFNKNETYTKEDILNREFAVLSFSPTEEYIDILESEYDNLCVDLSTYKIVDADEVFLKGIIVDIDRKTQYTIIHVQNKDQVVSITCSGVTLQKYDDYLVTGEPVIAKVKAYNGKLYLSLLVQLNHLKSFDKECSYLDGTSKDKIDEIMSDRKNNKTHYGLIIECALRKTKTKKDMIIGTLYDGEKYRSFGIVKTKYNPKIPKYAMAGDFVKFQKPVHDFFINNMEVVDL